jgi:hypothetical protein
MRANDSGKGGTRGGFDSASEGLLHRWRARSGRLGTRGHAQGLHRPDRRDDLLTCSGQGRGGIDITSTELASRITLAGPQLGN